MGAVSILRCIGMRFGIVLLLDPLGLAGVFSAAELTKHTMDIFAAPGNATGASPDGNGTSEASLDETDPLVHFCLGSSHPMVCLQRDYGTARRNGAGHGHKAIPQVMAAAAPQRCDLFDFACSTVSYFRRTDFSGLAVPGKTKISVSVFCASSRQSRLAAASADR